MNGARANVTIGGDGTHRHNRPVGKSLSVSIDLNRDTALFGNLRSIHKSYRLGADSGEKTAQSGKTKNIDGFSGKLPGEEHGPMFQHQIPMLALGGRMV